MLVSWRIRHKLVFVCPCAYCVFDSRYWLMLSLAWWWISSASWQTTSPPPTHDGKSLQESSWQQVDAGCFYAYNTLNSKPVLPKEISDERLIKRRQYSVLNYSFLKKRPAWGTSEAKKMWVGFPYIVGPGITCTLSMHLFFTLPTFDSFWITWPKQNLYLCKKKQAKNLGLREIIIFSLFWKLF